MSQQELLKKVVSVLDEAWIDYMVTGSVVSSLQGEPRSTHDIDLVVDLSITQSDAVIQAFNGPSYYIAESSVRDAILRRSMFNLLALTEGDKVDFWLLTSEPFDRSRFARRRVIEFDGFRINVSAPEDTILAKLRWSKLSGGSSKQFTDALRVYEIQCDVLDQKYMEEWAAELGVANLLTELKQTAKPLS